MRDVFSHLTPWAHFVNSQKVNLKPVKILHVFWFSVCYSLLIELFSATDLVQQNPSFKGGPP